MSSKKIIANDIRVGNALDYKNKLWNVLKREHIKPGKGGAYVQVEMKEIIEGTKLDIRFRSSENVFLAYIDDEEYEFLFAGKNEVTLMALHDYEQITVPAKLFDEKIKFLKESMRVTLLKHGDKIIRAIIPEHVVLAVLETDPYIKGQTAAASYKTAIMENGTKVMVPPFIKIDDKLVVNTNDNSYVERSKGV